MEFQPISDALESLSNEKQTTKAGLRRIRKKLMEITKLCKILRVDAMDLIKQKPTKPAKKLN